MLTENEWEWINWREGDYEFPTCAGCPCDCDTWCPIDLGKATKGEIMEAAEFESKVAVMLASWETLPVPCMNDTYCDKSSLVCPSCRLKYARLAIEEEMDAER